MRKFLTEVYRIWITERPGQLAAALAYYGIFSFAPVIFIAVSVAGIFINKLQAADRLYLRLEEVLGADVSNLVRDSVVALSHTSQQGSWLISLVGFLALLFAASGFFFQLQNALNVIWRVPPPEKGQTWRLIRERLFSFLIAIGLGLVLILSAFTNLMLSWLGDLAEKLFGISSSLIFVSAIAGLGLVALVYAVLYKILPDVDVGWRDVWLGALAAALLTGLGVMVIGIIFSLGQITSAFEAAGAFAVLLIGIYYIAQIFLLGAVLIRVYASNYGSLHLNKNETGS
jgi:membrane protein